MKIGWTGEGAPVHPGEQARQARPGARATSERAGRRVIRSFMPDQHRHFFAAQPLLFVGSLDARGRPWASVLTGRPGFMSSPDPQTLVVTAAPAGGDPLAANLAAGAPLGLLGLEFATRRRNRMNGRVTRVWPLGFEVRVDQSFGNCPQYIQARSPSLSESGRPVLSMLNTALSERAATLVGRADTFFIATASPGAGGADPTRGVDVSHRGGKPGFVRVSAENGRSVLTSPDFVGNFAFNTFGNLALDPRAGMLFVDFSSGDALMLTGEAEVIWDGPEVAAFAGAERLLRFRVEEGLVLENGCPLRWTPPAQAAQLAATGSWQEADALAAAARANEYRPFRVLRVENEAEHVRSFYLEPADGAGLPGYLPGQFLPLALDIPGHPAPVRRTYSLSGEPNGRHYRISVKRQGLASAWLHEAVGAGSTLRAMAPRGDFVVDAESRRDVVLLSGGVGVTPMMAMLEHLAGGTPERLRHPGRRVWFIHGARHGGEHAFAGGVRALAARNPNLTVHVRYSAPRPQDVPGEHYHSAGRVDAALLRSLLPLGDYDFYLCGPAGFMQDLYEALRSLGVREERIRWEAFAPLSIRHGSALPPAVPAATVEFQRSQKTLAWDASKGTLLDLAEAAGIDAAWSCRSGTCGTCAARLVSGSITYGAPPTAHHDAGQALVCSALPASERLALDL
jgi:ferredoxin-NADP reductase/predicted pyridoxine 5'-phosphate oxidase superfamily flavin-nucleotide-binding protein